MLAFSGFGMAALPLGVLADAIGLRQTMLIMGLAVLAAMAIFLTASRRSRERLRADALV